MLYKLVKMYGFLKKKVEPRKFPNFDIVDNSGANNQGFISIAKYWLTRRNRKFYMHIFQYSSRKLRKLHVLWKFAYAAV